MPCTQLALARESFGEPWACAGGGPGKHFWRQRQAQPALVLTSDPFLATANNIQIVGSPQPEHALENGQLERSIDPGCSCVVCHRAECVRARVCCAQRRQASDRGLTHATRAAGHRGRHMQDPCVRRRRCNHSKLQRGGSWSHGRCDDIRHRMMPTRSMRAIALRRGCGFLSSHREPGPCWTQQGKIEIHNSPPPLPSINMPELL